MKDFNYKIKAWSDEHNDMSVEFYDGVYDEVYVAYFNTIKEFYLIRDSGYVEMYDISGELLEKTTIERFQKEGNNHLASSEKKAIYGICFHSKNI